MLRSQKRHLSAHGHRVPEEIGAQRLAALVETQTPGRKPESGRDLGGIRTRTALAQTELGAVIASGMHRLHQMDDACGAIREFIRQPFAEQILDFERQAQEHVARFARTRLVHRFENGFDLAVVESRDDGRHHDGGGYPGLRELPDRLDALRGCRGALSVAAPFLIAELKLSTTVMGLLLSAFFWPYSFMQTPAGWAVDRYGVKRVYAWGYALWSLAAAATGLAWGLATLCIARVFVGVGQSVIFPAHTRAVANWFSARERGTATAGANAGNRLGQAAVNGIGPLLVVAFGWKLFFIATGVLPLVWLLPWMKFMSRWEDSTGVASTAGADSSRRQQASFIESLALLKQRSMLGIFLGFFAYDYAWILLYTWLPGYLKMERGFSTKEMAIFSSVPYLAGFVVAMVSGVLSDWLVRRGYDELRVRKTFMVVGMAIGCLIIPAGMVADKMTAVWLIAIALCGLSISAISSFALTQTVCERKITGTAAGLQNFGGNLGGIIAPALTGFIAHRTGSFALALGLTGALLVGGIAAYWLLVRERIKLDEVKPQSA